MITHVAESALVLALPGAEALAVRLTDGLECARRQVETRQFPDGEWYVRIGGKVRDQAVVIAATLHRPDEKLLPLLLLAGAARESGLRRWG